MNPNLFAAAGFLSSIAGYLYPVLGVLGIIGILGSASAYFYKNRSAGVISLQNNEITILKETNQRLENEQKKLNDRIKALENEVKALQRLVSQRPQIERLAKTITKQHTEIMDSLAKVVDTIVEHEK